MASLTSTAPPDTWLNAKLFAFKAINGTGTCNLSSAPDSVVVYACQ